MKLAAPIAGAALGAMACAPASAPPNFPVTVAGQFINQVVDHGYDAGRGASAAIGPNGETMVTYILAQPVLKKGELPPTVVPGQPQPPAVILASRSKNAWNRVSVTGQKTAPAQGTATELVDSKGYAIPGVVTSLAVDDKGKSHVAWSTPSGLFYATDVTGSFGAAEKVVKTAVSGASIALGPDGTSWISYYSGTEVRVAHQSGTAWTEETVASGVGQTGTPGLVTAVRVGSDGTPIVAYGANGSAAVARKSGKAWTASTVSGSGGYGISMALDKDGNPHVISYGADGTVSEITGSSGTFQPTTVAQTAPSSSGGADPAWSTGIGIDDGGTELIAYADTKAKDIGAAVRGAGQSTFKVETLPDSSGGTNPSAATSADGKAVMIAWYDSVNADLDVATPPSGGLSLAFPTPANAAPSQSPQSSPPPGCKPTGSGQAVAVVAHNIAFNESCYAVAAAAFVIDFDNKDAGVPHNFDIFSDQGHTQHVAGANGPADVITGVSTTQYKQTTPLKPGVYYFQCDIHPTQMNGAFVVAGK